MKTCTCLDDSEFDRGWIASFVDLENIHAYTHGDRRISLVVLE